MKKITVCIMTALLFLTFIPTQLKAGTETNPTSIAATKTAQSEEAKALLSRLDEIKAMDKSNMTSPEKRQLRKEVRSIKSRLNSLGDGVYLSVGAIIIILLLIIILL